jgi:hypothetical protein
MKKVVFSEVSERERNEFLSQLEFDQKVLVETKAMGELYGYPGGYAEEPDGFWFKAAPETEAEDGPWLYGEKGHKMFGADMDYIISVTVV